MNKLNQINRIKHLIDKETLLSIINFSSFVFSRLFYCSSVWSNTSATNIYKLQLVQNFAARIILGLRKYDHTSAEIAPMAKCKKKKKDLWSMMQLWCTNVSKDCYLVICQIDFQTCPFFFSTRATIDGRQPRYRDNYTQTTCKIVACFLYYCSVCFKLKFGFIKRVDKSWTTTVKDLESWRFER